MNITNQLNVASNFEGHGDVLPETFSGGADLPPPYEESLGTDQPTVDHFSGRDSERAKIYNCLYDESNSNAASFDNRHRRAEMIMDLQSEHSNGWYDGCFTRSCVCDYSGRHVIPEYITSGSLYRGRVLGWKIFRKMVLPLISDVFRISWAALQLIMWIILLALSSYNYSSGRRKIYNVVHLSLSVVALFLAIIDLGGSVVHKIKKRRLRSSRYSQLNDNESTHSLDLDNDHDTANTSNTTHTTAVHSIWSRASKQEWTNFSNTDIARLIIPELFLFPIVICDVCMLLNDGILIFENAVDWTSFIELLISLTLLVIQVYVLRLSLLAVMTYRVHTKRSLPTGVHFTREALIAAGYDPKVRTKGLVYLLFLIFNVVTHMINQIAMIIAIGVNIRNYLLESYDNNNYGYNTYDYDPHKLVFNFFFMIVAGYVLPIVGAWLFFSVTHFWLQEFAIGITVDYLSIIKLPGVGNLFFPDCTPSEVQNKVRKILVHNKYGTLRQDYHALQNYNPLSKAFYPFKSLTHTLMSLAYTAVQAVFIYTAAFSIQGEQLNKAVFVLVIVTELLSNIYTLLVSLFWIVVAVVVISTILLLLGLSVKVIICVAICCADVLNSYSRGPPEPPVMTPQIRMGLQQV